MNELKKKKERNLDLTLPQMNAQIPTDMQTLMVIRQHMQKLVKMEKGKRKRKS